LAHLLVHPLMREPHEDVSEVEEECANVHERLPGCDNLVGQLVSR
jgi:hypothetical protein